MKRSEIKEEYKWDNRDLSLSWDEWTKDYEKIPALIDSLLKYKGHLLDSPDTLLEYFEESEKVEKIIERLEFYTFLACDVDINDSDAQKNDTAINTIIADYNSKMAFVTPELMSKGVEIFDEFIKKEPKLKSYERVLKEPFRLKEHLLDERSEAMFADYEAASQNYTKSSQFIRSKELRFDPITLSNGEVVDINDSSSDKYLRSEDCEVRRQTEESLAKAYKNNLSSLASNYIGFVRNHEIEAKYRGYESQLDKVLQERKIPRNVYDKLMESLKKYNYVFDDYIKIYKDTLDLDEVHSYDLYAPLSKEVAKEYTFEEAKDIILDTFSIYGEWYTDILKMAFDKRLIDVMPSDEKVSGWSCAYTPFDNPRVFGNFYNKIMDISSMSHELGHFVNQYLTINNQIPLEVYQDTSTAEVASLTNEIVFSILIKNKESDKNALMSVIGNFLKIFASNFFGAGREAIFEERAHELVRIGRPADAETFNEIWLQSVKEMYGETIKDFRDNTWACIPHFYMGNGYYVYNYSIAIICACNVASKILNKEEGFMNKYHEFLKIGSNISPIEALMTIGIDLSTDEPYKVAIEMFKEAMGEYEKIMNEEVVLSGRE
ncbi:MAG: hypothetical protein K2G03_03350 [Bacilli bacterium]|nr:hypothetical protein [Bacilli bacterium]